MKKFRIKGVNDDVDTCDLCGKTGLKKVVWLVELDGEGEEIGTATPYGVCCAAKLLAQTQHPLKTNTKAARLREIEERMAREFNRRVGQLRTKISADLGLVEVGYQTYVLPEDSENIKGKFGNERIEILRKVWRLHPIFKPYPVEKDLVV